jgi:hypothetical protein
MNCKRVVELQKRGRIFPLAHTVSIILNGYSLVFVACLLRFWLKKISSQFVDVNKLQIVRAAAMIEAPKLLMNNGNQSL